MQTSSNEDPTKWTIRVNPWMILKRNSDQETKFIYLSKLKSWLIQL